MIMQPLRYEFRPNLFYILIILVTIIGAIFVIVKLNATVLSPICDDFRSSNHSKGDLGESGKLTICRASDEVELLYWFFGIMF